MRHGFWDISGKLKGLTCLYNLAGLKFQSLSHLWWADTELSTLLPLFLLLHLGQNVQVRILCYLVRPCTGEISTFPSKLLSGSDMVIRVAPQKCFS